MIDRPAAAIDDPAYVNGRGDLTDCLVWFALLGVAVRVHRARRSAGAAGRRIGIGRAVRGAPDPDRRRHGDRARHVGRRRVRRLGRGHRQGLPRHRVARASRSRPAGPLRHRARRDRLGGRPVRRLRGVRPPAAAQRRDHGRASSCSRTCRITFDEQLPYLIVFTRRVAVPADRDARVRRAGDVDPAPHRRPGHDLVALPARRHRVHPGRDGRLAAAHATRRVEPARGRLDARSTTSWSRSARRSAGCCRSAATLRGGGVQFGPHRQDRRPVVQQRRPGVQRRRARDRPEGRAPLLARGDLQQFVLGAWINTTGGRPNPSTPASRCSTAPRRRPTRTSRTPIKVTVRPDNFPGNKLLTPGTPTMSRPAPSSPHRRRRLVPGRGCPGRPERIHRRRAGHAGGRHGRHQRAPARGGLDRLPHGVTELYTDVPDGAMGPEAQQLLKTIKRMAGGRRTRTSSPVRWRSTSTATPSTTRPT